MTNTETIERVETKIEEAPAAQLPAVASPKHQPPQQQAAQRPRAKAGSVANIATAISAIMQEVGVVQKAGVNTFHRYKYATMQDILQRLTPLVAKHGLVIMQTEVARSMFDDDRAVAVEYEFTIAHTSGEIWPDRPKQTGLCRCRDSKGGFDDKALNKCHTAARKYFLLALFQIATGEEDDADEGHNDGPRRPARPAPNVMAPDYDPRTGEIAPSPTAPRAPTAAQPAPADAPQAAGAGEGGDLLDMAREAALRGEATFKNFYKVRSKAEQKQINEIGDELRGLMAEAATT